MPIYEYKCHACDTTFESISTSAQSQQQPSCPSCKSEKITKVISLSAPPKAGSERQNSPFGCGTSGFS